ncbi:MAG: type II toxin-antitoxin system VapC family toxin [Candidatus Aminicenantes bacterium]|nr:type II toxin-antitoxin system VapC family toxin [Candidatus Aminicenantes bacterium]
MSGHKVLLDSNIIIYLSKGLLDIGSIFEKYDELYISIITYMEVLGFQFADKKELSLIKELLNSFEIINLNSEIAEDVISIKQKKKIKLPDAIIWATAKFVGSDLSTRNVKDFCDISDDVNIINPFAEQGDGKDKKRSP